MQKDIEKYMILITNGMFPRLLSMCNGDEDKACALVKDAARKYVESGKELRLDEFEEEFVKGLTSRVMFLVVHQASSGAGGKDFIGITPCATRERAVLLFESTRETIINDTEMWPNADEWYKRTDKSGCPYHFHENGNNFLISSNEDYSFSSVTIEKKWVEE